MSLVTEYQAVQSARNHLVGLELDHPFFDEVLGPDGRPRQAWRELASFTGGFSADDFAQMARDGQSMLAESGAETDLIAGGHAPWHLDPVPFALDQTAWREIEVGIVQRAELLAALLADLTGPRDLLRTGVIPAQIIAQHPDFIRQLAGYPEANRLTLSAVDLGRDADGSWRVVADRTQAPAGLGYVLENRRVLASLTPDADRDAAIHRVDPFFDILRASLAQLTPDHVERPRVVLLSPGPLSETFSDQAWLARTLGTQLVQGTDLVVDDSCVWMRPAGWPRTRPTERVDVILRRVDGTWCDPLELRSGSRLGVTGLTEAVRAGTVQIANGLGAGVLESAALQPSLDGVCRALLGEELRLCAPESWWCGDDAARAEASALIREDAATFTLRFERSGSDDHARPTPTDRDGMLAAIEAAPSRVTVQRRLPLSSAPVIELAGSVPGVVARPTTLRTFVVRDGAAFRPLIGGLARIRDRDPVVTKDVWVIKGDPDEPDQGIDRVVRAQFARSQPVFPPRALDDLFWAGRYAERAEDTIRVLLTAHLLASPGTASASASPRPDHRGQAGAAAMRAALFALAGNAGLSGTDDLRSLLLDEHRRGSVAQSIARLRSALAGVRDQVSDDVWRTFAATDRAAIALKSSPAYAIAEAAGRMLTGLLSFTGVTASMIRDDAWHAVEAGRSLERATQVALLLRRTLAVPSRNIADVVAAVVHATESSVTYRRRFGTADDTSAVLDLLVTDLDNPRSIASSIRSVAEHIAGLSQSTGASRPERLVEVLVDEIAAVAGHELGPSLAPVLDDLRSQIAALSDAVSALHFGTGPEPQSIDIRGEPAPSARSTQAGGAQ